MRTLIQYLCFFICAVWFQGALGQSLNELMTSKEPVKGLQNFCSIKQLPLPIKLREFMQSNNDSEAPFVWQGLFTQDHLKYSRQLVLEHQGQSVLRFHWSRNPYLGRFQNFYLIQIDATTKESFEASVQELKKLNFSPDCIDYNGEDLRSVLNAENKNGFVEILKKYGFANTSTYSEIVGTRLADKQSRERMESLRSLFIGDGTSSNSSTSSNATNGQKEYPYSCKFRCTSGSWHTVDAYGRSNGSAADRALASDVGKVCKAAGGAHDRSWGVDCRIK